MPVKIRCRGCEKVLNAPDKARGRVIKCPNCQTKLKVPGGQAKSPRPARKPKRSDDDFLSGLDLTRIESEDEKVCPFCAAEMEPESAVCRSCGMNVETGVMDRREKKRRARRGPDPAKFYKAAWTESWEFMLKNWKLAVRTGAYWALFAILVNMCMFLIFFSSSGPPRFFWACMTLLSALGFLGWYWALTLKIIESTMNRDDKMLEYINFDIFETVALGLRAFLWPFVIYIPFYPVMLPLALVFSVGSAIAAGAGIGAIIPFLLVGLALFAFPALVYPLGLVHMTQRYTYKAWILWEMLIVGVKNLAPALYFWFMALALLVPISLMVFVPLFLLLGADSGGNLFFSTRVVGITQADLMAAEPPTPEINGWTERAIAWGFELVDERPSADGWLFRLIAVGVNITLAFLLYFPAFMIVAFPAVFLMKVNGLLGYYNRERLGLVNQIPENTPANFWVRVLAYLIDLCLWPFATLLVIKVKRALIVGWLINAVCLVMLFFLPFTVFLLVGLPLFISYGYWMYFTVSESSATRTTIGKDAFGLIVNDLDDKQIAMSKGTMRWFGRLACNLTLGLGYLIVAFHPEKRGLHDLVAGTRCCWKGDR